MNHRRIALFLLVVLSFSTAYAGTPGFKESLVYSTGGSGTGIVIADLTTTDARTSLSPMAQTRL